MNPAHAHLVLNHIPVLGIPLCLVFLVFATLRKDQATQKFALLCLLVVAALTVPAYLTGEPAEGRVEKMPGVGEAQIEPHEDAARASLALALATGALALGSLAFARKESLFRKATLATIGTAALATASLGYTASLGGKVRHTELREDAATPPSP